MSEPAPDPEDIARRLAEPFDPREVKWKPAVVSGNRAMALCYVDARVIQDRLDEVLGVTGWQDEYEFLDDGSALCRLRCRLGGEWFTKMDVGGQSEQPDEGDRRKAAISDALKRAAVKFGVGRYLYRLPAQWVDYDPKKKQFARTPSLPPEALPGAHRRAATTEAPARSAPAAEAGDRGTEIVRRLKDRERQLVVAGRCTPGEMLAALKSALMARLGHTPNLGDWGRADGAALKASIDAFEAAHPAAPAPPTSPQPAARPSPDEVQALRDLLTRAGRTEAFAIRWCEAPAGTSLELLSREQHDRLRAALEEEVARPAAAAAAGPYADRR